MRKRDIIIYIIVVLGAFAFGYSLGFGMMFDKCTDVAWKFLDANNVKIDKSLIYDYLMRAGGSNIIP